jgi:hypothetical protein
MGIASQLANARSRADGGELQVCICGNVPNFESIPGPIFGIGVGVGKARSLLI